ncbi:uncharacterized protein LOC133308125 isoform X2 [Gastrolobium bilobum]|nr:uncharacterized protein LOC133308125 isoform X2 [Gastrolobium bilobum]XP_061364710.1 uncharacterized protein LOC133308125 isoform X2 [Gastrolobium bilobum]XP_061364711.1 uncharacterized protein LOC133308125 isoform X2 [Gastrolobium bilobum]
MAHVGKVMPNCVYASNPYHECAEACLQKIKEIKPSKNKKSSDYRRSVTEGDLGKKMNEEKRTHSGCPKASNPYHVCDENCHKRMSGVDSGSISLNYGRKKKLGSKPEHPVLDSVPASKIGAIYLSDASSPIPNYSEKKKVEPKSNELIPVSGELHIPAGTTVNHKVQPKGGAENLTDPIRTKQEVDRNASPKVVPITSVDDIREGLIKSAGGSMHFCLSGVGHDNEDSDGEESESVVSECRIPVGKYHVKESFAPILRSIFDKYGDIGESCHLESVVMRSYYIECVCFVVQELQSTSIMQLTKSKVKELLAILKDVESAQLRIAWLRSIVDEIAENIELINQQRSVEMAKADSDRKVESLRKELESEVETLAQKEQELADIKTRIEDIREQLNELELKSSDLDKNMFSIKSKVDNLDSKSLLDELL